MDSDRRDRDDRGLPLGSLSDTPPIFSMVKEFELSVWEIGRRRARTSSATILFSIVLSSSPTSTIEAGGAVRRRGNIRLMIPLPTPFFVSSMLFVGLLDPSAADIVAESIVAASAEREFSFSFLFDLRRLLVLAPEPGVLGEFALSAPELATSSDKTRRIPPMLAPPPPPPTERYSGDRVAAEVLDKDLDKDLGLLSLDLLSLDWVSLEWVEAGLSRPPPLTTDSSMLRELFMR